MTTRSVSSPDDAHTLLKQFDCVRRDALSILEREPLRQALLLLADHSGYQILGICAEDLQQGQRALLSYADALGYAVEPTFEAISGPVYIKFNPNTGLCYANPYTGEHRGVLVSYQSAYDTGINDIYGHLPLNLFSDEDVDGSDR